MEKNKANEIVNQIKKDADYQRAFKRAVQDLYNGDTKVTHFFSFDTSTDLFGAFHNVQMNVETIDDNCNTFNVHIHDRYDFRFDFKSYFKGIKNAAANVLNNMAWLDGVRNMRHDFDIDIYFIDTMEIDFNE